MGGILNIVQSSYMESTMNGNIEHQTNYNESSEDNAISNLKNLFDLIAIRYKPTPPIAVMKFEEGCFGDTQ